MKNIDGFLKKYRYLLLIDAGNFFAAHASAVLNASGGRSKHIPRKFGGKFVNRIVKPAGLEKLLIDRGRSVLNKETTDSKSWGILWYDGVLTRDDGSYKYSEQHKMIKNIPSVFFRPSRLVEREDRNGKIIFRQEDTDCSLEDDIFLLKDFPDIQGIVLVSGDDIFHGSLKNTLNRASENVEVGILGIGDARDWSAHVAGNLRTDFKFLNIEPARLSEVIEINSEWLGAAAAQTQEINSDADDVENLTASARRHPDTIGGQAVEGVPTQETANSTLEKEQKDFLFERIRDLEHEVKNIRTEMMFSQKLELLEWKVGEKEGEQRGHNNEQKTKKEQPFFERWEWSPTLGELFGGWFD